MLKQLEIINFQSHKESKLEFSSGVNVIVGPSDSGKSAVIRALTWLCKNQPAGIAFMSDEETEVFLELNEISLSRFRNKKQNEYGIHKEEDDKYFEAMGKGIVPEPVKDILNISDENFQFQHDSPFLLSISAGKVSQKLNEVINLSEMDESLKRAKGKIKYANQQIEIAENLQEENEEKLKSFSNLEELENDLEQLEILDEDIDLLESNQDTLNEMIFRWDNAEQEIKENCYIDYQQAENHIENLLLINEKIEELKTEYENFNDLKCKLIALNRTIELVKEDIEIDQNKFDELMPEECPLCGKQI